MTSYNHEQFIKESIESILNQTFEDFELIIVDDCSTDSSFEIIQSFQDKRITAIRNEQNKGPEYAFEILHKTATGSFIAIADSDNVWEKDKLQKQVNFLEKHPTYAAVFTRVNIIDEWGNPYTNEKSDYYSVFNAENRSRQEWLHYFFYSGNCLCHPSILIRKGIYEDCRMTVNGLWQIPDFYKWIRLCLKHEIYILDEKLIRFRIHRNNISGVNNVENVLRSHNELYTIYSLFYEINKEDFLFVFKEAQKFVVNGKINIKFALSKLLLSLNIPAATTLALSKLFEMLNCDEERTQIFELYQYDDVSYRKDETKYSPFVLPNWSYYNTIYEAKLYLDFGSGFNEKDVLTRSFITDSDGNFRLTFHAIDDVCKNKKLMGLRFDPCNVCAKVKIKNITSKGHNVHFEVHGNNYSEGQYMQYNHYDIFYTCDPAYIIHTSEPFLDELNISGEISALRALDAVKYKNLEITAVKEEMERVYHTFSWKVTKPLRYIKRCLRKQK